MSGHSKWKQIKHKKAATDSKKGVSFTKLSRLITVAARAGGGDPDTNFRLRLAVDKAREGNLPNDNIKRAIEKAVGGKDAQELEEMTFEIFGPAGTKIIAKAVTDNKNRTNSDIKHILSRAGCTVGARNSVAWMFDIVGELVMPPTTAGTADDFLLLAVECGAEDATTDADEYVAYTKPTELAAVKRAFEARGAQIKSAQIIYKPKERITITNPADVEAVTDVLNQLDDNDDMTEVYLNADFGN